MICYIILHYQKVDVTKKCIDSLLDIISDKESKIIVVDNGSNNSSFDELFTYYGRKVDFIKSEENLGFAKGNNLGYRYAKKKYKPEIIVVCNNDLLFLQKAFESELKKYHVETKFDVCGPDIVNLDGKHQNPHRERMLSLNEVRISMFKRTIALFLLEIKQKASPLLDKIDIVEKKLSSVTRDNHYIANSEMVLQGSCICFGTRYILNEENAFDPSTFLYYEEDLLALKCQQKNYIVNMCDKSQVLHLESESSKTDGKMSIASYIFMLRNMIQSEKIYESKLLLKLKKV